MLNRIGFIPRMYRQPDYYKKVFNAWCAVYLHRDKDEEYHLQLALDHCDLDCKAVRGIEILKQNKTHRSNVYGRTFTTYKSAIKCVEKLLA